MGRIQDGPSSHSSGTPPPSPGLEDHLRTTPRKSQMAMLGIKAREFAPELILTDYSFPKDKISAVFS